ncbi:protein of unknown function DUF456 [Deinococcus proteolyticus MRP]|uniref:DUF456 domain-containing protein n=1 Tax=Deinococcus proteolyticus (strain ATCC 35074 / DSM 20540 / JCM 6276 / NBRC 101906 / NCIMB 13154 / VKM Ac-1939 / CCM 2703 / MRP) TaxID=693977 RepID=F0RLC6_DEIPM|nr:DUF456 family protein [Deinococcus proteolyticus]ADY25830.1 protein of unknown function DUF456 [Deinococcus proteolyticus MRP]
MTSAFLVFLVLWLLALVGTFIPVIPATALLLIGGVAGVFLKGYSGAGDTVFLAVLVVLTLVSSFADNIATAWGAGRYGGSKQAMWGAIAGSLAGLLLGPLGILVGPLLGAFAAELLLVRRPVDEAARSAFGTLVGLLTGMAAKFVLNLLIGLWALWRFWGQGPSLF